MTIQFEHPDSGVDVETVLDDDSLPESINHTPDPDVLSDDGSRGDVSVALMSEMQDRPEKELPEYCLFSTKECRCRFTLRSDRKGVTRICGNTADSCVRQGHRAGEKGLVGYYPPIKALKYYDGHEEGFLTIEECEELESDRKEQLAAELTRAGQSVLKDAPNDEDLREGNVSAPNTQPSPPPSARGNHSTQRAEETSRDVNKLMGVMESLALTVSQLEARQQVADKPVDAGAPLSSNDEPTVSSSGYWCGVGHGQNGTTGVYSSWGETAPHVLGVSHAIFKKFSSCEEAAAFVEHTKKSKNTVNAGPSSSNLEGQQGNKTSVTNWWCAITNWRTGDGNIEPTWKLASPKVTGVRGATVTKFRTHDDAQQHVDAFYMECAQQENHKEAQRMRGGRFPSNPEEDHGDPHLAHSDNQASGPNFWNPRGSSPVRNTQNHEVYSSRSTLYPPEKLMGKDESTKEESEFFGIDLNLGETELRSALCPPDVPEEVAKALINGTIDVASLPGAFANSGESGNDASELGVIGEAVEELVNQRRGTSESTGRVDLHWRGNKRTSLHDATSLPKLRKQTNVLMRLQMHIHERMKKGTTQILKRGGWQDSTRISAWATFGFLPVLVQRAFSYYLNYHQHLLSQAETHEWNCAEVDRSHHLAELKLIRELAESRLQCICHMCTCLRDAHHGKWFAQEMQQERNAAMMATDRATSSQESGAQDDEATTTSTLTPVDANPESPQQPKGCSKCGTWLCGPNGCACGDLPKKKAQKAAKAALRALANKTPADDDKPP